MPQSNELPRPPLQLTIIVEHRPDSNFYAPAILLIIGIGFTVAISPILVAIGSLLHCWTWWCNRHHLRNHDAIAQWREKILMVTTIVISGSLPVVHWIYPHDWLFSLIVRVSFIVMIVMMAIGLTLIEFEIPLNQMIRQEDSAQCPLENIAQRGMLQRPL